MAVKGSSCSVIFYASEAAALKIDKDGQKGGTGERKNKNKGRRVEERRGSGPRVTD